MSHYACVPKTLRKNLEFRKNIRAEAAKSAASRKKLLQMCQEDTLFFINAFAYLIEPRDAAPIKPFITWPHQDRFFQRLDWNLEQALRGVRKLLKAEKSRAEGFSWSMEWWGWKQMRFRPHFIFGQVSRNKETADIPDEPGSLMGKMDWMLTGTIAENCPVMPTWLCDPEKWERKKGEQSMWKNLANGAYTRCYAATDDVGSGARWTAGFLDEWAKFFANAAAARNSVQHLTYFLTIGSTYKGRAGEFYDIMQDQDLGEKFVFDWKENPTRNRGMYRLVKGKPVNVEEDNPLTPELWEKYFTEETPIGPKVETLEEVHAKLRRRGFELDEKKIRSPWYDKECLDGTPMGIAEELDRSPSGAEEDFMPRQLLEELTEGEHATAREPKYRGKFVYDAETLEGQFVSDPDGPLLVWCELIPSDPKDPHSPLIPKIDAEFVMGCDVSYGVGSSNSSTTILDRKTGEQAADFTHAWRKPADFTRDCIALAKWFHNAYLGWEVNGACGGTFTRTVLEIGYGNVYRRQVEEVFGGTSKPQVGWKSTTNNKADILGGVDGGGLLRALLTGDVQVRNKATLVECSQYVIVNGAVVHMKAKNTQRESAKNEAHGDRVIGLALAVHLRKNRPMPKDVPVAPKEPVYGSREWRDAERGRLRAEERDEAFSW